MLIMGPLIIIVKVVRGTASMGSSGSMETSILIRGFSNLSIFEKKLGF